MTGTSIVFGSLGVLLVVVAIMYGGLMLYIKRNKRQ